MRTLCDGQGVIVSEGNAKRRAEALILLITIKFAIWAEINP